MWTRNEAILIVCLTLVAVSPLNAKFNYKKFSAQFDSSDENIHTSSEEREELEKSSSNDGYTVKYACYRKSNNTIFLSTENNCGTNILVAVGKYVNKVNETGWGILEIETFSNGGITEEIQAYAAGVLEGGLF
jgi:hypothetical protein